MNTTSHIRILLWLVISAVSVSTPNAMYGQALQFERAIAPFRVLVENTPLEHAFIGGFNTPRPEFVDIDGDGDNDLFIQEQFDRLMFFENTGSSQEYRFEWRTDRYLQLNIGSWYTFVDTDSDGDFDVFAEGDNSRIRYYENSGDPQMPEFSVAAPTLVDVDNAEIVADRFSIPTLIDMNCDAKPDLFLGDPNGTISYYQHISVDANNAPVYRKITDRFQDFLIVSSLPVAPKSDRVSTRHGANAFTFTDINADDAPDLFWGDFFSGSVFAFSNMGSCATPLFDTTTVRFPAGEVVATHGYNVPRFSDIDADGDMDFFVGVQGGSSSIMTRDPKNFYYYENVGSAEEPLLIRLTQQFIACIDVGTFSIPAAADLDNDGDMDILIGNQDRPDDVLNGQLWYFENTGSVMAPELRLADDDFQRLRIGANLAPAFADIDNDNDYDLIIGEWDGRLNAYKNVGDSAAPEFEEHTTLLPAIDVGNNAAPALVDIDGDGDPDLFIGNKRGVLAFYRNNGDASAPAFVLENAEYGGIDIGAFSIPFFVDIEGDGDADLVIGSQDSGVTLFRNRGTATQAQFEKDENFIATNAQHSAPLLFDFDGDNDIDCILGRFGGGLEYYRNLEHSTGILHSGTPANSAVTIALQPNPASAELTIRVASLQSAVAYLRIFTISGAFIRQLRLPFPAARHKAMTIVWDGRDANGFQAPSGVYVCAVFNASNGMLGSAIALLSR